MEDVVSRKHFSNTNKDPNHITSLLINCDLNFKCFLADTKPLKNVPSTPKPSKPAGKQSVWLYNK